MIYKRNFRCPNLDPYLYPLPISKFRTFAHSDLHGETLCFPLASEPPPSSKGLADRESRFFQVRNRPKDSAKLKRRDAPLGATPRPSASPAAMPRPYGLRGSLSLRGTGSKGRGPLSSSSPTPEALHRLRGDHEWFGALACLIAGDHNHTPQ